MCAPLRKTRRRKSGGISEATPYLADLSTAFDADKVAATW